MLHQEILGGHLLLGKNESEELTRPGPDEPCYVLFSKKQFKPLFGGWLTALGAEFDGQNQNTVTSL